MLFFITLTYGCKQSDKNCSLQYVDLNKNVYKIKGCLIDSLEEGYWYVYDTAGKVSEAGNYEKGIRTGNWYYANSQLDSIISWKRYSNKNLDLLTNIPSQLRTIEDNLDYIKLSNLDTSNLLNIVVTVHDLSKESIDVDKYYKHAESEIHQQGWVYAYNRQRFTSKARIFYLNEYKIDTFNNQGFMVLNIYSLLSNSKLVEITCRYNVNNGVAAKNIFFSIVSNCFINNIRFLNPFSTANMIAEKG